MSIETQMMPSGLRRTIARIRRARAQARTEMALGALPDHIRKDIGWPDSFAEQQGR